MHKQIIIIVDNLIVPKEDVSGKEMKESLQKLLEETREREKQFLGNLKTKSTYSEEEKIQVYLIL